MCFLPSAPSRAVAAWEGAQGGAHTHPTGCIQAIFKVRPRRGFERDFPKVKARVGTLKRRLNLLSCLLSIFSAASFEANISCGELTQNKEVIKSLKSLVWSQKEIRF